MTTVFQCSAHWSEGHCKEKFSAFDSEYESAHSKATAAGWGRLYRRGYFCPACWIRLHGKPINERNRRRKRNRRERGK